MPFPPNAAFYARQHTNIVYLISTELAALKEISEMCGEYEVKEKDKNGNEKKETRPLITVSDLQRLKFGEIILLRLRSNPFRTKIKPNFDIDWGESEKSEKAHYPHREKEEVHLFDLKGFVNKKREEKMNNLVNSVMPGLSAKMGNSPRPASPQDLIKNIDAKIAELEKEERLRKAKASSKIPVGKIEPKKIAVPKEEKKDPNDFIKAIDSKIKQLEKEQEKKEVISKINSEDFAAKITNKVNSSVNKQVDKKVKPLKNNEEKSSHDEYVTDDQFFDDFFSDDE